MRACVHEHALECLRQSRAVIENYSWCHADFELLAAF